MKSIIKLTFGLFLLLAIGACSNDFDLIEGEVNVPIIYGFLNAQDSATYIRVEKAFVDSETPASVLAMDPDQLYYDNAVVRLIRTDNNLSHTLTRVDGNLEGYQREEGAFANAPNYLYKISNEELQLEEEVEYRLEVEIPGEETVTATTTVVEQTIPIKPNLGSATLDFPAERSTRFTWTNGNFAILTSGSMVVRYLEEVNDEFTEKSFVWRPFKNSDKQVYEYQGREFYSVLASNIEQIEGAKRFYLGIDFTFASAGQEVQDILQVAQANLGITSSGEIPNYSNLSRGRGIFSSRTSILIPNIQLTTSTEEELKVNDLTEPLNFQ